MSFTAASEALMCQSPEANLFFQSSPQSTRQAIQRVDTSDAKRVSLNFSQRSSFKCLLLAVTHRSGTSPLARSFKYFVQDVHGSTNRKTKAGSRIAQGDHGGERYTWPKPRRRCLGADFPGIEPTNHYNQVRSGLRVSFCSAMPHFAKMVVGLDGGQRITAYERWKKC